MIFYLKFSSWIALTVILLQNAALAQKGVSLGESANNQAQGLHDQTEAYEIEFPAMGTMVQIIAYSSSQEVAEAAFREAELLTSELASLLSDYDPHSETRKLTQSAFQQAAKVSEPLWQVLQAADNWYRRSDGTLDCSLGSLTAMWRKYRRAGRTPSPETVQQAKHSTGWQHIQLDHAKQSIEFSQPGIRLDFGAIGKGYIVDQIYELLQQHGLNSCLVNISGNMRLGEPPPNRPTWRIAVSPLEPKGQPLRWIGLAQASIATSGDLWQYSIVKGQKRSHILDPTTGYGVPGPLSVTVIAPTAIDADALATIGCLMDWSKFNQLMEVSSGVAALRAAEKEGVVETLESTDFPAAVKVQEEP